MLNLSQQKIIKAEFDYTTSFVVFLNYSTRLLQNLLKPCILVSNYVADEGQSTIMKGLRSWSVER